MLVLEKEVFRIKVFGGSFMRKLKAQEEGSLVLSP